MAEKPIDPRIDEALKKCNPQKAIYALADLMDDYQGAIDRAQATADGAQQTADTAITTANEAVTTANAAQIAVGEAFDNTRVTPNSSTVVVEFDRINGNEQNVALPVVNTTNAGILNANDYKFFKEYDARIRAVEGVSKIYLVELPSDNPSSQQITLAYTSQWPDAPNPPLEGTVVVDPEKNNLSYRWNTQSNIWYKISEVAINQFTNTTLGTIKGSTQDGEVQANADGTGSVTGWDTVKANISALEDNSIVNIRPTQQSLVLNLELINGKTVVKNITPLPAATSAGAGVMTSEQVTKLNSLGAPAPILKASFPILSFGTSSAARTTRDEIYLKTKIISNTLLFPSDLIVIQSGNTLSTITELGTPLRHNDDNTWNYFKGEDVPNSLEAFKNGTALNWYGPNKLKLTLAIYPSQNDHVGYSPEYFPTDRTITADDLSLGTIEFTVTGDGIENAVITVNPILAALSASTSYRGSSRSTYSMRLMPYFKSIEIIQ